jgi:hypothetical protein
VCLLEEVDIRSVFGVINAKEEVATTAIQATDAIML